MSAASGLINVAVTYVSRKPGGFARCSSRTRSVRLVTRVVDERLGIVVRFFKMGGVGLMVGCAYSRSVLA